MISRAGNCSDSSRRVLAALAERLTMMTLSRRIAHDNSHQGQISALLRREVLAHLRYSEHLPISNGDTIIIALDCVSKVEQIRVETRTSLLPSLPLFYPSPLRLYVLQYAGP